jgi:hypothetical protein
MEYTGLCVLAAFMMFFAAWAWASISRDFRWDWKAGTIIVILIVMFLLILVFLCSIIGIM